MPGRREVSSDQAHSHTHVMSGPGQRAGARHKGRLLAALVLLGTFMVVEVVASLVTNSLALLSDAGHMVTDVIGLAMALVAIHVADRADARDHRTFGLYRLEILAALANAALLLGVGVYVLIEAIVRFSDPPDVLVGPVLVVAVLGLGANLVAFAMLRSGSKESLNVEGAYLEVLSDTAGSVGVIVAAIVLGITGWGWVDPLVGVAIGLFIVPRTVRLGARAVRILVQAAPAGTDPIAMQESLRAVEGVVDVHDLHVWTLTSDMLVATAHLMVRSVEDSHAVLDRASAMLRDDFGIEHATLQVEPEDHEGCSEVTW